nr:C-type lectin [Pseudocerastes urarachnoides]
MVFSYLEYETIDSFIPGFVVKLGTIGPPPVAFIPDIVQSHPDNTIFQHCQGLLDHKICFCNVVQGDQMAAFVLFSAEFLCIFPILLFLKDLVAILIIGRPTRGTTESSSSSTQGEEHDQPAEPDGDESPHGLPSFPAERTVRCPQVGEPHSPVPRPPRVATLLRGNSRPSFCSHQT